MSPKITITILTATMVDDNALFILSVCCSFDGSFLKQDGF